MFGFSACGTASSEVNTGGQLSRQFVFPPFSGTLNGSRAVAFDAVFPDNSRVTSEAMIRTNGGPADVSSAVAAEQHVRHHGSSVSMRVS